MIGSNDAEAPVTLHERPADAASQPGADLVRAAVACTSQLRERRLADQRDRSVGEVRRGHGPAP